MKEEEREAFINMLRPEPDESLVAFVAMGGIFAEGVDLPGDRLSGAAIVGVGLPMLSYESDLLSELYEEKNGAGFETAYVYPGIGKCLQAAGRVIRTETDRGAILFIDERYNTRLYASLLSPRYKIVSVKEDALSDALNDFWKNR